MGVIITAIPTAIIINMESMIFIRIKVVVMEEAKELLKSITASFEIYSHIVKFYSLNFNHTYSHFSFITFITEISKAVIITIINYNYFVKAINLHFIKANMLSI